MEASLTVATQGLARAHVTDPLAEILVGQLSEHTRRAYRHDVSHLLLFLQEGPAPEWGELTREAKHSRLAQAFAHSDALRLLLTVTRADLIAFRTHLKEVGPSTLATNRRLAGVGSFLRELQLQGYRPDNPASGSARCAPAATTRPPAASRPSRPERCSRHPQVRSSPTSVTAPSSR